jgi:muconolactone D-isomerase
VQAFPARIIATRRRGLDEPRANVGDEAEGTVEFLVNIEVDWPPDGDPEELARLTAAERVRGAELAAGGTIRRMWRVPGRRANWGVWEAEDATALHAAIGSLPFFPYLDVEVIPLAAHPTDPERPGGK